MGSLLSLLLTKNIHVHENPWILSGTLTSPMISKLWPEEVTHVTSVSKLGVPSTHALEVIQQN